MSSQGQPGSSTVTGSSTPTKPSPTTPLSRSSAHFPAPFRFLFTFPGVIRRPMPSGLQRNSQRPGKLPSLTLPHLRGSVCHRQLASLPGCQKLLQSKGGGHNKLLQKGSPLSVSGSSFPPRPPARFAMPAARGKTSLNATDW